MLQFSLKLYSKFQRPAFDIHYNKIVAMLDTGALYPVWTKSEELLVKLLNAKLIKAKVPVSGFGGTTEGNAYTIPILQVGNLMFTNIHIIASNMVTIPFSMILSATMFQGLIYEIDTVNNSFNVTIPDNESNIRNYKLLGSDGNIHILSQSANNLDDIDLETLFTKEEAEANYINTLIRNNS